jgi:hypothetical protein
MFFKNMRKGLPFACHWDITLLFQEEVIEYFLAAAQEVLNTLCSMAVDC